MSFRISNSGGILPTFGVGSNGLGGYGGYGYYGGFGSGFRSVPAFLTGLRGVNNPGSWLGDATHGRLHGFNNNIGGHFGNARFSANGIGSLLGMGFGFGGGLLGLGSGFGFGRGFGSGYHNALGSYGSGGRSYDDDYHHHQRSFSWGNVWDKIGDNFNRWFGLGGGSHDNFRQCKMQNADYDYDSSPTYGNGTGRYVPLTPSAALNGRRHASAETQYDYDGPSRSAYNVNNAAIDNLIANARKFDYNGDGVVRGKELDALKAVYKDNPAMTQSMERLGFLSTSFGSKMDIEKLQQAKQDMGQTMAFVMGGNNYSLKDFKRIDTDGNGTISQREFNVQVNDQASRINNRRGIFSDFFGTKSERTNAYADNLQMGERSVSALAVVNAEYAAMKHAKGPKS